MNKILNYIKRNSLMLTLVAFVLILQQFGDGYGSTMPFVIGASGIYNRFKANLMQGDVNLDAAGDAINVALMDTNHTFTATNNEFADVSANEITGTGYTAGGEALANQAVTQGATTKFDADDVEWTSATFSAFHGVIYDDTLAGNDLIASIDFGGEQSVSSGTFTIQWDAAGIITIAEA